jgi:hypothetical protein
MRLLAAPARGYGKAKRRRQDRPPSEAGGSRGLSLTTETVAKRPPHTEQRWRGVRTRSECTASLYEPDTARSPAAGSRLGSLHGTAGTSSLHLHVGWLRDRRAIDVGLRDASASSRHLRRDVADYPRSVGLSIMRGTRFSPLAARITRRSESGFCLGTPCRPDRRAAVEQNLSVAGHGGWGAGSRRGDPDHRHRGDRRPRRLVPGAAWTSAPARRSWREAAARSSCGSTRPSPVRPTRPCGSSRCRASSTTSRCTAS